MGEDHSVGALYGRRSERKERLLDQLELALDELTTSATEDALAAEKAAARTTEVKGFVRRKPSRKPFPEQPNSASQCLTPLLDDGRLRHGPSSFLPCPLAHWLSQLRLNPLHFLDSLLESQVTGCAQL